MATPQQNHEASKQGSTRSVERALTLLVGVATNNGINLVELARNSGLSPATALRLLRTLEAADFIRRDEAGAYFGASKLVQIAVNSMNNNPLYRIAEPHLEELRNEFDETSYLGVPGPRETVLYARLAEAGRAIRHQAWLGQTVPLVGTAIGSALQGSVDGSGFVLQRQTIEDDVTAIAAPIRWIDGTIAGAISVVGPSYRIDDARAAEIGASVARHAALLRAELSGTDSPANPVDAHVS